jgi:hypothetical protein
VLAVLAFLDALTDHPGLAASSPGHGLRPGQPRSRATRTSLTSTISYGAFIRHPAGGQSGYLLAGTEIGRWP